MLFPVLRLVSIYFLALVLTSKGKKCKQVNEAVRKTEVLFSTRRIVFSSSPSPFKSTPIILPIYFILQYFDYDAIDTLDRVNTCHSLRYSEMLFALGRNPCFFQHEALNIL